MSQDTPQQAWVIRTSARARKVRKMFPDGTRVRAAQKDNKGNVIERGPVAGTVKRHVPGTNSQGGYLLVEWDNGITGRIGAISLMRDDGGEG